MKNKKLIFIVNSPRSGSTLLLSYLSGLPNTKILYETKVFQIISGNINEQTKLSCLTMIGKYFDHFEEEIVIEKTPEHCFHLEDIEKLRKLCTRDIHVIYLVRPPVPTILSTLKAAKANPEIWGEMDLLGACEKYESSLLAIYNNLILKKHREKVHKTFNCIETCDIEGRQLIVDDYVTYIKHIPYSLCVTYRELTQNPYKTLESILNTLCIEADIQSLIDNRIDNTLKAIPQIVNEKHHENVLKSIEEVELGRNNNISKQLEEGVSERYKERFDYIRSYFEHPISKETIYDLVVSKKKLDEIENPLVTVVVPLCNKQDYIEETLSSIANQTYQNIRVVIVDDGSTDNSLEVARKYISTLNPELQRKFSDLYLGRNRGVSEARNIGLSSIKAEMSDIITFCDADDIWDTTLVEKSVATFKKYPYVDCVYSRVQLLKEDSELIKNHSKICNGDVYEDALEYNFLTCGSNIFVKASVIEEHSIRFNTDYNGCEDWDFLIQLAKVATFKCTKEYLVKYRQLSNSLSSNRTNQLEGCKQILETYLSKEDKKFSRIFTRLFLHYFSIKNIQLEHIRDLDISYILRVVVSKLKDLVKSYLP